MINNKLQDSLSKGFDRRIDSSNSKAPNSFQTHLPVDSVDPSPYQPRTLFNQEDIESLANSIDQTQLIQPITVRKQKDGRYELIAGERRLRAHQYLGKKTIEAKVVDIGDADAALMSLAENFQRADLTDFEIYQSLANMSIHDLSMDEIAKKLGYKRQDMYRFTSFEVLPKEIIADLNVAPGLLGRSAATNIKTLVSKLKASGHSDEKIESAIIAVWDKIKNGEILQKNIVNAISSKINNIQKPQASLVQEEILLAGKPFGKIKYSSNKLSVDLKIAELGDAEMAEIQEFFSKLLTRNAKNS